MQRNFIFTFILVILVNSYCYILQQSIPKPHRSQSGLVLNAKRNLKSSRELQQKVDQYIRIRDLKKQGNISEDSLLNMGDNNVISSDKEGYKKFVGKGTLDQRLRAIIAYKKESAAMESALSGYITDEEEELRQLENSEEDEDYDEVPDDDIDLIYEREIQKVLETRALQEIQRNMVADKELRTTTTTATSTSIASSENSDNSSTFIVSSSTTTISTSLTSKEDEDDDEDGYTPARSSWGVFKRPRDISKTYGGGRVITREEVERKNREYEMRQLKEEQERRFKVIEIDRTETENKAKLTAALMKGRRYLQFGDRYGAVQHLESVQPYASVQSELGAEVLLELAMALETVNRTEDARKLYGNLLTNSASSKVRRNALGLLQGLDIVSKLRKDITTDNTPLMDYASMHAISTQLRESGLKNEWNDYKKKTVDNSLRPWYDSNDDITKRLEIVNTFRDAYFLSLRVLNPLKKIPSEAMQRMFRKMYITNDTTKIELINREQTINVKVNTTDQLSSVYYKTLNGTWEVVISLTDRSPYTSKRYETGAIRVCMVNSYGTHTETTPGLWGLGTITRYNKFNWNGVRKEIEVLRKRGSSSSSIPMQTSDPDQTFQIVYVDDEILVTRQGPAKIGGNDMYILWKRVKQTVWKKY